MALVLFDSNIIIDYLNGIAEANDELTYWDEPAISVIDLDAYRQCSRTRRASFCRLQTEKDLIQESIVLA